MLSVASRKNASPEARETAKKALEKAWLALNRRGRLINAAIKGNNHFLYDKILTASKDQDAAVARIAKSAIEKLKLKPAARDDSPKISTLSVATATAKVVAMRGDASLGKQIFAEGNSAACHNLDQKEVQKGPFLGNIAKTYKRAELAAAVLEPSKTIAQ